ncbi:DUF1206 domain-containing protein [Mycobacterium sp. NPDC050041]|uniref:DUF1206 domain-containing protein n=1 Tax=Mycobacterium sp. NPDC050041 TaxID=3364293 RepID=UPI003C2B0198
MRRGSVVHRATRHDGLQTAARSGYVVSGLLHLLIAYVIVRIALGHRGDADPSGALATVAETRGGAIALWVIVVALVPLMMWRLAESLIGLHPAESHDPDRDDAGKLNRLKAFGLLLVYCGVMVTAVRFAAGDRESSRDQNTGISSRLMHTVPGQTALIVTGIVVAVIGGYYAYKGASRRFLADLTGPVSPLIVVLGLCGYVAEGIVLAIAGVLLVVAAVDADPSKAAGLDAAVKALGATQAGTMLLIGAAVGFGAYGLYSLTLTRYSRM